MTHTPRVVTSGGTDVKYGVGQALALEWEWSVPHSLDPVGLHDTGLAIDKRGCKNPLAGQLMGDGRRIVEHFKRSDAPKVRLLGVGDQQIDSYCSRRNKAVTCPKSSLQKHFKGPLSSCYVCSADSLASMFSP